MTFKPVLSEIDCSKFFIFGSFEDFNAFGFFLKIFTRFSLCLTDSFFSIIFLARNNALSKPTKIFACPALIFLSFISSKISDGKFNNLN